MKITFSSFVVLLLIGGIFSCKKDNFNYPKGTVGSSKIIYFPSIATKGDKTIYLKEGDSYGDSGAVAKLNGADVQYTTNGSADPTKPGIYNITYTAVNPQGYSASDWRTVVVIGNDVAGNDFSGQYGRIVGGNPNGQTSTWTKTAPGIYTVENPGGAGVGAGLTVIAVNYTGNLIGIPHQISPDLGEVSSVGAVYNPGPPANYQWAFIAGGYGSQVRYFTK